MATIWKKDLVQVVIGVFVDGISIRSSARMALLVDVVMEYSVVVVVKVMIVRRQNMKFPPLGSGNIVLQRGR